MEKPATQVKSKNGSSTRKYKKVKSREQKETPHHFLIRDFSFGVWFSRTTCSNNRRSIQKRIALLMNEVDSEILLG
jgi:hypothetical protein